MLSLAQAAGVRGDTGQPLPTVWKSLEGVLRRGQLGLVAAGPGTGKSALVLNYVLKSHVSALYFSADSDPATQLARALAVVTGSNMAATNKQALEATPADLETVFKDTPAQFSFDPSPSLEHITMTVRAYLEQYGDYPELIIIDNAMDVVCDIDTEGNQAQSLDALMSWLHDLARTTQACVIVLHHVTALHNDANHPIPLSGVKGQIGRVPELILTLHRTASGLGVSTVKNRGGIADPTGQTVTELLFDGYRMNITDSRPNNPWATN